MDYYKKHTDCIKLKIEVNNNAPKDVLASTGDLEIYNLYGDLEEVEEEISLEIEQEQKDNKIHRLNSLLNKTKELKNRVNEYAEDDMLDMMYPNKEEGEEYEFDD